MEISELPKDKKIILFDGVCNLCSSMIQYVIKRDKKDVFRFAPIQSEIGQKILRHIGVDPAKIDSVVMYEPGVAYYVKSAAAVEIGKNLSGIGRLNILTKIFPGAFRDSIYDYVAKNRYKWYGKTEDCLVPTPEILAKFL